MEESYPNIYIKYFDCNQRGIVFQVFPVSVDHDVVQNQDFVPRRTESLLNGLQRKKSQIKTTTQLYILASSLCFTLFASDDHLSREVVNTNTFVCAVYSGKDNSSLLRT